ncbi:hypothetical protein BDQ12DRAFT_663963 [Crucibulum laeve]|uniref:Uncharacterized protein n=1 Tax=Crucibulum laeve TaxID=68775 RepID=A0A5C3MBA7_9AGAR|nr:hypothetical protein BDQ12DRAFT_663963 [Crucibulum laeve]
MSSSSQPESFHYTHVSTPNYVLGHFQYPSSPSESSHSDRSDTSSTTSTLPPYSCYPIIANESSGHPPTHIPREPSHNFHGPGRDRIPRISSSKISITHPYARLFAKKDEVKRRKIWNHALEKALFSPYELSTMGAPQRRTIYIASLEAHVDRLHNQLYSMRYWPVPLDDLEPLAGLNSKTAKSMVAGLQYNASVTKLKLLELERASNAGRRIQFPIYYPVIVINATYPAFMSLKT